MIRNCLRLLAALTLALSMSAAARSEQPASPTVFAAASLTNVMEEIGAAFAKSGGVKPRFSYAASSTLAKQIESGAGAHVFVSADEAWMAYLSERKLIVEASRGVIATNSLVVVVPSDKKTSFAIGPDGAWLASLPAGRIATGDPAHVPVGKYAKNALTALGVWDKVEPRLARADNVRSALVLVERGEAVAGIVYATDAAISKQVTVAGVFPKGAHEPIVYPAALVKGEDGNASAARFLAFLGQREAREIFVRHGFSLPGNATN